MTTSYAVSVLLRARLLIARNSFLRRKWWQKAGVILFIGLAAGFATGLYLVTKSAVAALRSPAFASALEEAAALEPEIPPVDPTLFLPLVPSFILFAASLMLVLSSFGSLLSSLYLAGDMDMLLSKPVPMRSVFIVKFFSGLLPQYGLLFVLLGPVLLGYGSGMGYGWLYMLVAVVALLLLPLIPIGLGSLLVMAVVRVVPARRARDIASILGGIVALLFYVFSQFAPELAPHIVNVNNARGLLQLDLGGMPSTWAGQALIAAGEGALLPLALYSGLFLLVSLLVFASCLLLAERLYYAGWSNMVVQGGKIRQRPEIERQQRAGNAPTMFIRRPLAALFARWQAHDPQSLAIFRKDWRVFPRDMRNVQQLIFPIALAGIWVFRLLTLPDAPVGAASEFGAPTSSDMLLDSAVIMSLSSIAITFFLCYTISNAIAGTGINREQRTLWLLKLAPVPAIRVLLGKGALAYLPYLLFGTPILLVLSVLSQSPPLDFAVGWLVLALLGLGTTSLSLALGAVFPRLDTENPQLQPTLMAGCLNMLLTPSYIAVVMVAVFGLPALVDVLAMLGMAANMDWLRVLLGGLGWALAVALTTLVAWASLSIGARGLERIEL
jgi:ABC-2 type transport system permease protein